MNLRDLFPKIMGWLVVIVTLALAPSINTANATVVAWGDNSSSLIGLGVVSDFGAPLIILGLLFTGAFLGIIGIKGQLQGASISDMLGVIGSVVLALVVLSIFPYVCQYTVALIAGSSGFATILYGIIPLVAYLGVIAGVGWTGYRTYKKGRRGGRRSRGTTANY